MGIQSVLDGIENYFKAAKIDKQERESVLDYVKNGDQKTPVPDFGKRKVHYKDIANTCKPIFSEITAMQTQSEAFDYAYRFWQYLINNATFEIAGNYDQIMLKLSKCGLTFKEAMLLDIIITDFTAENNSIYRTLPYQRDVFDKLYDENRKLYEQLRDTLLSLTEEEVTFNARTRAYYAAFIFGALSQAKTEAKTEKEIYTILTKYRLVCKLVGQANFSTLSWYSSRLEEKCYLDYVSLAEKKGGNLVEVLQREGEYSISLAHQVQIIADNIENCHTNKMQQLKDAFLNDEQIAKKIFSVEYISLLTSDALYNFMDSYFEKSFDCQSAFNGICYSPSKKVTVLCSKQIDIHKKEASAAFKEFITDKKLAKVNAEAVKALLDKWTDEDNAKIGFADLKAVEAFAAGEKLVNTKILNKFDFSVPVYGKDKKTRVSEYILKVFLDKYFSMKEIYRNRRCDNMAAHFDIVSFRAFIDSIYAVWEMSEFDNKLKMAVVPYCFYTSNSNLLKLKKQCVTFCDSSRHTLAAYIIQVIAMNGGKYALMLVDSIANKFQYPKAKQVARDAMAAAAAQYNIPIDVLGDMIIPNCDISSDGTLLFDDLKLILQPDGDLKIKRGDKILKSLPSDVTAERKKDFSAIKKDIKTVLQLQTVRLERALMLGRAWLYKDFERFYVNHPIMRMLISRLVMGVYSPDGKLKTAFRIGLDGRAENVQYDEVALSDDDIVACVHPCDLDENSLNEWRVYLADNEIKQPFQQILQPVYYLPKSLVKNNIIGFEKYDFNSSHISKLAKKYNMIRLPVEDAGSYAGYYLDYSIGDIGFELLMDELFVLSDSSYGKDLSLGFYRPSKTAIDYWTHEEQGYISPDEVPTRLLSSLFASLSAIMPGLPFEMSGKYVPNEFKPFINENDLTYEEPEAAVETEKPQSQPDFKTDEESNTKPQSAAAASAITEQAEKPKAVPVVQMSDGDSVYDAYLEFIEGTSSKFWKIEVKGNSHTVTFGRIGTAGTQSSKTFDTQERAVSDAKKLAASKIKKGYIQK